MKRPWNNPPYLIEPVISAWDELAAFESWLTERLGDRSSEHYENAHVDLQIDLYGVFCRCYDDIKDGDK